MKIAKGSLHISQADDQMAPLIISLGKINLPAPKDNFESLVDAIVSQQLSVKAAATIYSRLVALLDMDVRPERVSATPPEDLRSVGLSGQKARYMHALAEAFIADPEAYRNLEKMNDMEVLALLTQIKGIGIWTAQMFLMFNLLREDIFPIGDLGIRKAMQNHLYAGAPQNHETLIARAEIWKPYRTVACLYLWKSLK